MLPRAFLLLLIPALLHAAAPAAPKPPVVNDPALRIELLATQPEVEACTTVCGAPDGSFYVGNDPRDGRLSTREPVDTIVRFSSFGPERRRTIFADKIYSPAGSAWHDGFLYVVHDPFLTRFKDTDGDGIADVREDLITNLGLPPGDGLNDHVVSGITLGMDGFFYLSVGDRGIYQAKSVRDGSTVTMRGGGIVRCRPDGTQLEIFSTGTRNHLSVLLDAEDNAFTRDNTDDGNGWWTRLTHHIEGGYYGYPYDYQKAANYGVTQPSQQTLDTIKEHGGVNGASAPPITDHRSPITFLPAMADFGPGSPTGGVCYLSDGLPEKYRGRLLFSEWGKQGIFVTEVAREGATFKLVSDTKLVEQGKGADFRPMQISVAADGSLLIADWGYGGWKGPRVAGAVWRLSWPEATIAPRLKDESKASEDELIAALGHPDRDQRLRAEFGLVAKGEAVLGKVPALLKDESFPTLQRIHAVWALALQPRGLAEISRGSSEATTPGSVATSSRPGGAQEGNADRNRSSAPAGAGTAGSEEPRVSPGANLLQPSGLSDLFRSNDSALRLQAARVIGTAFSAKKAGNTTTQADQITTPLLVGAMGDSDPAVRLHIATALGKMGVQERAVDLQQPLSDGDAWVRFAAQGAMRRLGKWDAIWALIDGQTGGWSAWKALEGTFDPDLVVSLAIRVKTADPLTRSSSIATLGGIAYQPAPYDGHWWGTQPVKNPPPLNSVAWKGTPQALATLTAALGDADPGVRLAAAKAFSGFILDASRNEAGAALRARLTAETEPPVRRQLVEALGVQKDPQAMEVFRQIALDEKADAEFRETAIGAVVNIGGDAARKTIAQLAEAKLSPAATRKVIVAAGDLKVLEAAPALIAHLKDGDAENREFSARSLQQLGRKSHAGPALIEALADADEKVQTAVIEAVGSFREKGALPALLKLVEEKKALKEATTALAGMPDESAIPVMMPLLRDKNTSVRRNAIKVLTALREKTWPQVEALLAGGTVPEELVPEIRNAFQSGAIVKWKMVGVFENVWDAVHEPEKEALSAGGTADESPASFLAHQYHNAEGHDAGWIDVSADSAEGRVDLADVFKTNAMVCAYAFTEIDAPESAQAKLFTSADDEIAVWLNGRRVLNVSGTHGYEPDRNETGLQLRAGRNQLLVKIGNKSGPWLFHARIPGLENGRFIKPKELPPEEKQRAFALLTKPDGSYANPGEAKNGEKLFFDPAGALGGICGTCHTVKGRGGVVGPELTTVGANYKRPDLIVSIHEPSKTIALGFEPVMIETTGGETVLGSLRSEAGDAFTIVDATGKSHAVKQAEVKKKTDLHVSLMPVGLTLGLKPEEFADLLAYLESLR